MPFFDIGSSLSRLRWLLAGIFLLGTLATAIELWFHDHYQDRWQWVPLALLAIGFTALELHLVLRQSLTRRHFFGWMVVFIAGGFWGLWLHFSGNLYVEREAFPSLTTLELAWKSMKGAAPALAPGTMILLGLVGIAFAYCDGLMSQADRLTKGSGDQGRIA